MCDLVGDLNLFFLPLCWFSSLVAKASILPEGYIFVPTDDLTSFDVSGPSFIVGRVPFFLIRKIETFAHLSPRGVKTLG